MYKFFTAEIVGNTSQNTYFKLLTLRSLSEITAPLPGQFYMIQTGTACDPLLKRPFSIYSVQQNSLSFLYRVRGKGTLSLSQLREGDMLQIIGPLGNSYPDPEGDFIAVAGGIGLASLFAFMTKYRRQAYLFYGAMSGYELVMLDEARELSRETFITTDDGSGGRKGLITGALRDFLDHPPAARRPLRVYACGPAPMLRAVSEISRSYRLSCCISLEEHMACGIGACLGCMVKTVDGQKRVCKEGPVFNSEDIIW